MENNKSNKDLPKSIEVEGQTVEEAIKKATELFNVAREDIVVRIVSEEKKGLFGMEGAKPAKIKATLKRDNIS